MITQAIRQKTNIKNLFKTIKYNKEFKRDNPDYFYPQGFISFVGIQGGGKTLSAVLYVETLMKWYQKCKLVTNIELKEFPVDNKRVFKFEKAEDLLKYKNGKLGVIFLIDEIHLYMGSMKGNENLNPEVLQEICQQRKQRVHIVSTTQFFAQLNINLRRHFDTILYCESKFFNFKQKISVIDRESMEGNDSSSQQIKGEIKDTITFWRSPEMFEKYDTYEVINKNIQVGLEREVSNYDNSGIRLSSNIKLSGSDNNNSTTNRNSSKNWGTRN